MSLSQLFNGFLDPEATDIFQSSGVVWWTHAEVLSLGWRLSSSSLPVMMAILT